MKGAPTERREKDKQDGDPEPAEPTRVPEVTAAELSSDEGHNPAPSPNTDTFLFFFLNTRKSKIKDGAARPRSCLRSLLGTAGPHPQGTHLTSTVSGFASSKFWTRKFSPEKELVLALSQQ